MSELAPTPSPTPTPTPSPEPTPAPVTAQRPEWLPDAHWDAEKATIKDDFGAHYTELTTAQKTAAEQKATLAARKPEDIKFAVDALPPEIQEEAKKLGLQVKIDENDPRIPIIREMAIAEGWDQPVINKLFAMDAQLKVQQHAAEMARVAAEDKLLGANVNDRKQAVANWANGLLAKGDLTKEEFEEVRLTASSAAGVTALEKIIAKANGSVPGNRQSPPPPPPPQDHASRIWPQGFSTQKVS